MQAKVAQKTPDSVERNGKQVLVSVCAHHQGTVERTSAQVPKPRERRLTLPVPTHFGCCHLSK